MCDRDALYTLGKYSTKINDALLMLAVEKQKEIINFIDSVWYTRPRRTKEAKKTFRKAGYVAQMWEPRSLRS